MLFLYTRHVQIKNAFLQNISVVYATKFISYSQSDGLGKGCKGHNPIGGHVVEWLEHWALNLQVPGPSPKPCHSLGLFSVAPSSTPWVRFVYGQLVCLLSFGIFKHYVYSFIRSFIHSFVHSFNHSLILELKSPIGRVTIKYPYKYTITLEWNGQDGMKWK